MQEFSSRTKIICGTGAVSALKDLKAQRLFLVTDPYFAKNGVAEKIAQMSQASAVEIFQDVVPDPSVSLAAEGTARVKAFHPDVVVALGGGSAMDCAKAMLYFSAISARLVAIPTTSGSGSEVTDFAILTHEGIKHPLVDPRLAPELAILDDDLLHNLPKTLVADAGFDVLAHALEALVGSTASPITDALAKDAFCTAFAALPASFGGQIHGRQKVHMAATMAGMAFTQAGLGLCHGLAHALGGRFHVPHGRLNAVLLPAVISCNAHVAGEKYASVARAVGLGGSADTVAVRNLRNGLIRLRKELELPDTLARAGIPPRELWHDMDKIVRGTLEDPCCRTNPMKVEDFMVRKVLEEVMGSV